MAQLIISGVALAILLQAAGLTLLAGRTPLEAAPTEVVAERVVERVQLAAK